MTANKLPKIIDLEITNNCNFNCIFCPREHMERKKGFMSLETLKSIVDKFDFVQAYVLSGLDEPLIHQKIKEIIHLIKSFKKILIINTNGSLVTKNLTNVLIKEKVDRICTGSA